MAQPQAPNPANVAAAINGMNAEGNRIAQSTQAYSSHQNRLTDEMQQQLADLQRTIQQWTNKTSAQIWNLEARMRNGKVNVATAALTSMVCVDPGNNPQVPIGNAIPNFPATPDDISDMDVHECRRLLTALNWPIPGDQVVARTLQTAVRDAVGLAPL
ncbi:uncharacterized protein Z518_03475 [Rhinocladiella mackenziei CBS 650.93]|uniref:Uncharacterized protein n=1 Tax=Rhinocladiella mackenziei CBS 650.93 TaxID=1442369 RepID=A0A0D2HE24_9EURO|nr:uncharacterized protein Z518_03475 [Rhinocladiella mackenziei CBS 650.93]KIX08818.1 hypothetical protein Z518_03475 [Rhinocladiella mackenziei CBS 650.93]